MKFSESNLLWNFIILMINSNCEQPSQPPQKRKCDPSGQYASVGLGGETQILIIDNQAQIDAAAVSTLIHNFRSPTSLAAAPLKMGIMPSHSIPQLTTKQVWPKNSILSLNLILLSSFFMISWCHPHWFTFQRSPCGVKKNTTNKESANCRVLKLLILADGWCVTVPFSVRRGIPPMKTYDRLALM